MTLKQDLNFVRLLSGNSDLLHLPTKIFDITIFTKFQIRYSLQHCNEQKLTWLSNIEKETNPSKPKTVYDRPSEYCAVSLGNRTPTPLEQQLSC